MSTDYEDITGEIIATAQFKAKPGKADELAQWLANMKAHADSDAEPGSLSYAVVRHGDAFAVWEKYTGAAAVKDHLASTILREFIALELIDPQTQTPPAFYLTDGLPAPTMKC
ncbi:hypothetical protein DFH11DRAFT_1189024 [Phellopilus nigrolimitatus]|nr:hypothetical protein DFH11DRAFT_1189024 [Phellopilus nigrolimitatus]